MACSILSGEQYDGCEGAVFVSTSTGWAFGPVMRDREQAELFRRWLGTDPRDFDDATLETKWGEFLAVEKEYAAQIEAEELAALEED